MSLGLTRAKDVLGGSISPAVPFPLTQPSPQGEGALTVVARAVWRPRFVATRPIVPLLLWGEGRGEGERGSRPYHRARISDLVTYPNFSMA